MEKIEKLAKILAEEIAQIDLVDQKITALNSARRILHEASPLKHHPVDFVEWIKSDDVEGNDYNPNKVAPPEMRLLIRSIDEDGYTMPIVTHKAEPKRKIVDGFHRRKSERESAKISNSTFGHIPATCIRASQTDEANRMASTIRHNRARGTHDIDLMINIVGELTKAGMSDGWIMRHIGMDADEILRLKQLSGLAEMFKNHEFGKAWE